MIVSVWRTRVLAPNALIGLGGLLMAVSMFFRLGYGPWGQPISYFGLLSWNLSWPPSPLLLLLWPVAFGLLEAAGAAVLLRYQGCVQQGHHWRVLAAFLGTVAALQLVVFWWNGGMARSQHREVLVSLAGEVGVLAALLVVAGLPQPQDRRSHEVRLIGAAWVLVLMFPTSSWAAVETALWFSGPGYWMLLAGALLVAVGALRQLISHEFGPGLLNRPN
jgi:hypothetical protein